MPTHSTDVKPISSSLYGIVLAARDDRGLAKFIRKLRGDDLPKPFVSFIGKRSMLEHTLARAEKLIAPDRLFLSVSREQMKRLEVRRQISARERGTVIVQPEDKGSLPEVMLPLLHIYRRDPLATVVLLPADHFVFEESRFVSYLYLASRTVERSPASLLLLGIKPEAAEADYGYILPAGAPDKLRGFGVERVASFVENPSKAALPELLERGALWNTMAIVFKAFTLFDLTARLMPSLHTAFESLGRALVGKRERQAVVDVYKEIESYDFSADLLEQLPGKRPDSLLTLPVEGVLWSDWRSPQTLVSALTRSGYLARANDVPERRLFALWASQESLRKRSTRRKSAPTLRLG
ncbi:MAG TPA: sugar phosphate nucleotidyltransferase [Candidatus Binatia bacterium]|jgi:mannose-1-phosphate guanylyltransferase